MDTFVSAICVTKLGLVALYSGTSPTSGLVAASIGFKRGVSILEFSVYWFVYLLLVLFLFLVLVYIHIS